MKLYTKTGDRGETGLYGGQRVAKDHLRIAACGDVDETCASLGWVATCQQVEATLRGRLQRIQADLFTLGAQLANPSPASTPRLDARHIASLEGWIDEAADATPALRTFILPGGGEAGARLHFARGVCRRAERAVVRLHHHEPVAPEIIEYLNRLSDLLFALARQVNHAAGESEIPWSGGAECPPPGEKI